MKWWESDLRGVNVGDEVWVYPYGEGKVFRVTVCSDNYPIHVVLSDGMRVRYDYDGKVFKSAKYPSCWVRCPFELPPEPAKRPNFEVDHKVIVGMWNLKRHFCRWPDNPNDQGIFVYIGGCTSFTTNKSDYFALWRDAEK